MAMKQQSTPFQLRNPYRLDRPNFDALDVVEVALAEEEETHRLHLLQQQYRSSSSGSATATATASIQRPLPPQPTVQQQKHSSSFEDDNQQPAWNGINRVSNSIKRIKDFQRKNSIKGSERRQLKQQAKQQQQHQQHQQVALGSEEVLPEYHHSYSSNSWLQPKGSTLTLTKQQQQRQQPQQPPQPPIPTITVTHHIDTHSELTFERHVEWLTQTALWWDMPVYVETAASRFGSWVNFVKIPPGEDSRPGPATMAIKSANAGRVKGSRVQITSKETTRTTVPEEDDTLVEGGMVMGHARKTSTSNTASSTLYDPSMSVEPVVGYVFVGSVDEQAQYSQVFEAMERLYPMIEIRYINSFEPQHLQSRQQQELREEPCLQSLSWVHYWSAAKESQVLQSRIINEVVRVRPMWVNNELLHRNYSPPPPPQFSTLLTTAATAPLVDDDIIIEILSPCPESASAISPSPSVYIDDSMGDDDDHNEDRGGQSQDEAVQGVPSRVSIETLHPESDSAVMDEPRQHSMPRDCKSDYNQETTTADLCTDEFDLHGLSKRWPILSRTQSSHDIRHDGCSKSPSSSSSQHRRSKKSRSSSSTAANGTSGHKNNETTGYRRSVSTPLLLLTKGSSFYKASSTIQQHQHHHQHHLDRMDSSPDSDTNMSPPPPLLKSSSYSSSSASNLSSSTSSMTTASMGFGHRLAGLAQRLGVYRVRGSALMVVDL
ncbi:hypothetical protein BG015_007637 [Linnemannia schmuckeri]|uniref:Uncharacterized protein n=1 Tax=Linnemannia schmuckeri TaxID=64567 RepID=A0A9P5S0F5_9FUNG|nr:hypothetical protein BG015_007637 [Linnemannia schmuckeri]